MNLHPRIKRKINRIIFFGLFWASSGLLYSILERGLLGDLKFYPTTGNVYEFTTSIIVTTSTSLFFGLIMGIVEIQVIAHKFRNVSFGLKIFYKASIYVVSVFLFMLVLTFIANSINMDLPFYDMEVVNTIINFILSIAYASIIFYISISVVLSLFLAEISDNLGQGVMRNFFVGKYHKPVIENRVFMFLDMKSSTTIAEQLGHDRYYQLLNDYYADLTEAILDSYGEIYQYVGDEVVVSWHTDIGLKNGQCLDCFFMARDYFKQRESYYRNNYNLLPEFKAGFHYGSVTTGEVGVIKKEIVFTGDELNTAARIQSKCNDFNVDILVSDSIRAKLESLNKFQFKTIGDVELRGKSNSMALFTVSTH